MAEMARSVVSPVGAGLTKQSSILLLGLLLFVAACNQEQETGVEAGGANGPRGTSASASSDQGTREQIRNEQANKDADRAAAEQARKDQLAAEERRADAANNTRLEEIASQERIAMRNAEVQAEQANLRDLSQQQNTEAQKYISDNNLEAQLANARTQESSAQMQALATVSGAAIQGGGNLIGQMANASALKDQAQAARDAAAEEKAARMYESDNRLASDKIRYGGQAAIQQAAKMRDAYLRRAANFESRANQYESDRAFLSEAANTGAAAFSTDPNERRRQIALLDRAGALRRDEAGNVVMVDGPASVDASGRPIRTQVPAVDGSRVRRDIRSEDGIYATLGTEAQNARAAAKEAIERANREDIVAGGTGLPEDDISDIGEDPIFGSDTGDGNSGGSESDQSNPLRPAVPSLGASASWQNTANLRSSNMGKVFSGFNHTTNFTSANYTEGYKQARASITNDPNKTVTVVTAAGVGDGKISNDLANQLANAKNAVVVNSEGGLVVPTDAGRTEIQAQMTQAQSSRIGTANDSPTLGQVLDQNIANNITLDSSTTPDRANGLVVEVETEMTRLAASQAATGPVDLASLQDQAAFNVISRRHVRGEAIPAVCDVIVCAAKYDLEQKLANTGYRVLDTHEYKENGQQVIPHRALVVLDSNNKLVGIVDVGANTDLGTMSPDLANWARTNGIPLATDTSQQSVDQLNLRRPENLVTGSPTPGQSQTPSGSPGNNPASTGGAVVGDSPQGKTSNGEGSTPADSPLAALDAVSPPQAGDKPFVGSLPEDFDFGANAPANNNADIVPLAQAGRDAALDSGDTVVAAGGTGANDTTARGSETALPSLFGSGPISGGAGAGAANQNGNSGPSSSAPSASNVNNTFNSNSNNNSANSDAGSGSDTIGDGGGVGGLQRDLEEIQRRAQQEQYVCVGGIEKEECAGFTEAVNDLTSLRSDAEDLLSLKSALVRATEKYRTSNSEADRLAMVQAGERYNESKDAYNQKLKAFNEKIQNIQLPNVPGKTEATMKLFEDALSGLEGALESISSSESNAALDKLAEVDSALNILNDQTVEDINYADYRGEGTNGGLASYRAAGSETANYRGGNVSDGDLYLPRGN